MTHIDFYILQNPDINARWYFTCRLIEKAWRLGHRVLVAMDSPAEARQFDEMLWTFKPESFLPHRQIGADAPPTSVEIATDEHCADHHDVMVNLSNKIPGYFSRFQRLSEVVVQEPSVLESTREHFSFYKSRGYPIQHRHIA